MEIKRTEPCPCGKGQIEYVEYKDCEISLYKVFLDSFSFGQAEYVPCCKKCEDRQRKTFEDEFGWED